MVPTNLSNSASMHFIHSPPETLPVLSVSIASNSCLAASVAAMSFAASSVFSAAGVGVITVVFPPWVSAAFTTITPAKNTAAMMAITIGQSLT